MALALAGTAALGFSSAPPLAASNAMARAPTVGVTMQLNQAKMDAELAKINFALDNPGADVPPEVAGMVMPTSVPEAEPPAEALSSVPWNPLGAVSFPLAGLCVPEFLLEPPPYLDGMLAGDVGFDPLCLVALAKPTLTEWGPASATDRAAKMASMYPYQQMSNVAWMREAELKHARLAMLAAVGWPLAELVNGPWLNEMGTSGRAPSLFNGALFEDPNLQFLVLALAVTGAVEYVGYPAYGNFGFDPLGISTGQGPLPLPFPYVGEPAALQTAEIKNGRLAMMAITGMAVQEFVWGTPIVEHTPLLFGH